MTKNLSVEWEMHFYLLEILIKLQLNIIEFYSDRSL